MKREATSLINHWPHAVVIVLVLVLSLFNGNHFSLPVLSELHNQWWGIFTGHLVHTNHFHLAMNLAGFILLVLCFPPAKAQERALVLIGLCCLVSACILMYGHFTYFGLSGVLHGYAAYWLLRFRHLNQALYGVCLLGLVFKVFAENTGVLDTQQTATLIEAPVAVSSHLYGALSGLILFLLALGYRATHSDS